MRKKVLATLLVGAVAVTSVVGLAACKKDGNDLNKGAEVSAEEWVTAFENTAKLENFTTEMKYDSKSSGKEKVGDEFKEYSYEGTSTASTYYDLSGKKYYDERKIKTSSKGLKDAGIDDEDYNEDYVDSTYTIEDSTGAYRAEYNTKKEGAKWEASTTYQFPTINMGYYFDGYSAEKNGAEKNLSELYTSFTYSGGYYTATLFNYEVEMKVTVSVKDGYVIGFMEEGTATETDEDGSTETQTIKRVLNISNIGSTSVSAPSEAVAAIDAFKAK